MSGDGGTQTPAAGLHETLEGIEGDEDPVAMDA